METKMLRLEELLFLYIKEVLMYDIVSIVDIMERKYSGDAYREERIISGWRVKARVKEIGKKSDSYYSIDHNKVFIIETGKFTKFKRDKNLEELLEDENEAGN